jgi:3-oxoacyl-[acyl-carrier-protein] synthase II
LAIGGDATHLTSTDPDGRTLRRLLAGVVGGRPLDLVHAHGTGTIMNDPIELAAIDSTINSTTLLYSHKGALGHSLGASGLVSIVLNCMSHRHGLVPPNVRTHDPLSMKLACINRQSTCARINRSLAIASGFGGPMAVVALVAV